MQKRLRFDLKFNGTSVRFDIIKTQHKWNNHLVRRYCAHLNDELMHDLHAKWQKTLVGRQFAQAKREAEHYRNIIKRQGPFSNLLKY